MADDPSTLAAALLEEVGWVRGLATQLIGESAADDVAQDAWMAAAKSKPTTDEPLRPWLAVVVRKLAHTRRRSEARRRAHESSAAAPAVDATTPEALLAKAEILRLVGELVAELDEPYRSTLLLRHYEGLSSPQIAARLGIADGTVRWRLKEGLEQLRRALDRRAQGGRRGWMLALGTTFAPPKAAIATVTALEIAAVVSVIALGGGLALRATHHARRTVAVDGNGQREANGSVSAAPMTAGPSRASLEEAQRAYVEGRYDDAIQLARQAQTNEPAKAWRVIGASSCFKGDSDGAGAAWSRLDTTGRKFIEYVCARNHVAIPKAADGRKLM